MAARLRQVGTNNPQIYVLKEGSNHIGREERKSDLQLNGERASRRHALVRGKSGHYEITDLNSTNGTMVNGQRLPAQVAVPLAPNAVIEFAGERFIFEQEEVAPDAQKLAWVQDLKPATANIPANFPGNVPGSFSGNFPGNFPGQMAQAMPGQMPLANPFATVERRAPNYLIALLFGIVATVIAAEFAFLLAIPIRLQTNWIATLVGFLVGGAITVGGGRRAYSLMVISAIFSLVSSVLATLFTAAWVQASTTGSPFAWVFGETVAAPGTVDALMTPANIALYTLATLIGATVAAPVGWKSLGRG